MSLGEDKGGGALAHDEGHGVSQGQGEVFVSHKS